LSAGFSIRVLQEEKRSAFPDNTFATCTFAAALFTCTELGRSSQQLQLQPNRKRPAQIEGFQLVARLAEGPGIADTGKPIVLSVILKNVSGRSLALVRTNFLYDFTIEVQNGSGRDVELTELGKLRRRNAEMYISREHFQLAPGKVLENTVEISELFKMTKPDRYSITFKRLVPKLRGKGWTEVRSNTVQVSVS
jgi:hypothetical protein